MSSVSTQPFHLTITGNSSFSQLADRALLKTTITHNDWEKRVTSEAVLNSAMQLEKICRTLAPTDNTPEAKANAPLAHWSKTSLSFTSRPKWPHESPVSVSTADRMYTATIEFDIRFKGFAAMGPFAEQIAVLPHVEVGSIDWVLLPATRRTFTSRLRAQAARDAVQKATAYCSILCPSADGEAPRLRPLQLLELESPTISAATAYHRNRRIAQTQPQMQMQQQQPMQSAPGMRMAQAGGGGGDTGGMDAFAFTPQEVKMTMAVEVKFVVDTVGIPLTQEGLTSLSIRQKRAADNVQQDDGSCETLDEDGAYDMIDV